MGGHQTSGNRLKQNDPTIPECLKLFIKQQKIIKIFIQVGVKSSIETLFQKF